MLYLPAEGKSLSNFLNLYGATEQIRAQIQRIPFGEQVWISGGRIERVGSPDTHFFREMLAGTKIVPSILAYFEKRYYIWWKGDDERTVYLELQGFLEFLQTSR